MRKVFIGLGILAILLIIGVLAVAALVDVNRNRPQIEGKLRDRLERNVSLGEMRLSWMPPAFRVDNVFIDEDPSFASGRPFAHVQQLFIRPRLLPLFRNEIQIASVQLQQPKIELVKNEQGVWNY